MLATILLALAQPAADAPQPIPSLPEATERVAARDAAMFYAAFEGCDPGRIADTLTEDFRMLHDLGGLVASSRDEFVAMMEEQCAAREPGGANEGYANRRLITPGSVSVTPLGDWGVLQRGFHTFLERRMRPAGAYGEDDPGGPTWMQTGGAYFINVWQWNGERGRFEMQETISVDHGAAPPYPPAASD